MAAAGQEEIANIPKLRKQFEDFASLKKQEADEQREARRYYHASQWTKPQLDELRRRGQPATTTPVFARKMNGFVGLVERLRQDPKAYPRTDKEQEGADLVTASLRYVLDEQEWKAKSPVVSLHGAVDAIGGVELGLTPGDSGVEGDYDITVDYVEPDTFFYDPRSFKADFSDARYMGVAKWMDIDDAKDMFPDKADQLQSRLDGGDEFAIAEDREVKWTNTACRHVLIVEHWYRRGDRWFWCFYTSSLELESGQSFLQDEKGRDECRFIMWSSFVDQDGDRYGFHRNMKSLVDEVNQRNSKALHLLAMRRIIMEKGAVDDPEQTRREAVRPDGLMIVNPTMRFEFEDAKNLADMRAQLDMKEAARTELENFGPNPALVGQGVESKSGRAIELLQQAGLAELGPYIISYKGWKIRVYRAIWNAIRQYWKAERWIRVTDANGEQQPVPINGVEVDPITQMQTIVNRIGALDVDIIIDEGPDTVNMMADALETLQTAVAQGQQIPPQVMIELLPLPDSLKKKLLGMITEAQQPNPIMIQSQQAELAQAQAKVRETEANTVLKMAQAQAAVQPEAPAAAPQGPTSAETLETLAKVDETKANTILKLAQAHKTEIDADLAPQQMAQKAAADRARAESMAARQPA